MAAKLFRHQKTIHQPRKKKMYTLEYPHNQEYSTSLAFQTQIIKKTDGEQRIAKNLHPTRTFDFKFELSADNTNKFLKDYKEIRQNPFLYSWCGFAPYYGKDATNKDYLLRFDSSKISLKALQFGYSQLSVPAFSIDDGSIFKCRYPRIGAPYEIEGDITLETLGALGFGAKYQSTGKLSQKILTPNKSYRAKIKSSQTLGPSPMLSAQTTGISECYITAGEAEIVFVAGSELFSIEFGEGSAGTITEIAVYPLSKPDIPRHNGLFAMDFDYNEEHTVELENLSVADEILTPQYAVREYNSAIKRRFSLTLELTPFDSARFEEFFCACMGRYRAFFFDYQGERLKVRFDSDKAVFKVFPLGYSEVKIPVIEL